MATGEVRNATKKFQRIPAKWKDYSVCGKVIHCERLVAFKTPLSEEYHCNGNEIDPNDCLQKDEEFTPTDLRKIFRKRGHVLGLVVDFTNTKRYYQSKEFTTRKIEYKKIKCEGKIIPPEEVVKRFKATILSFFKRVPNTASIVGVHCTHGLNRAGYIICRYLIECRGYSPKDAIEAFNEARGHNMERENYLEDLQKRKPQELSEEDIEHLIQTSPPSDEESLREGDWGRDYRDRPEYRRRSDRYAPYRPTEREPHGTSSGRRGYRRGYPGPYDQQDDYWEYEMNYHDDNRVDSRFFLDSGKDTSIEMYERGHARSDRGNMVDERSARYRGRDRHETGRNVRAHTRFYRDTRRRDVDHQRYKVDHRETIRGHTRNKRHYESYEDPTYRERDDRSRIRTQDRFSEA